MVNCLPPQHCVQVAILHIQKLYVPLLGVKKKLGVVVFFFFLPV